ncbi:MAG: hypothetical protein ACLPYS_11915 [Vulcanimicrobiaceae bacterium]
MLGQRVGLAGYDRIAFPAVFHDLQIFAWMDEALAIDGVDPVRALAIALARLATYSAAVTVCVAVCPAVSIP